MKRLLIGAVLVLAMASESAAQQLTRPFAAPVPTFAASVPAFGATVPVFAATVPAQASTGRLITGGIAGGAAGLLVGGAAGMLIGGNQCKEEGNPDSCRGFEGMVAGASLGMSIGIPVGTHVANRRSGRLLPALAISIAMPAIVAAIAEMTNDDRVYTALLVLPIAQIATSVAIEGR